MTKALILSGGGPVGVPWEIGMVAGLEDGGLFVDEADFVLGTSAGSIVGAQITSSRGRRGLFEERMAALEAHLAIVPPPGRPAEPPPAFDPDATPETRMRATGEWTLAAESAPEQLWVNSFVPLVGDSVVWPEGYACTAVDTATGELAVWGRESGVSLVQATSWSCCVPGLFPPVTINGKRYMDGGVGPAATRTW